MSDPTPVPTPRGAAFPARPRALLAAVLAVLLAAFPAHAGQLQDDADTLDFCVKTGWPRDVLALCTGIVTDPCQAEPGGETSKGMNLCLAREADAWDAVMNRQWPRLLTGAREVDATNQTGGFALDSAAETLAAAHRAWIVFRDAECRYNYASWGTGSFRNIAHSACRLDLTARRVVDFHARLVLGR